MKLVSYKLNEDICIGAVVGDQVVHLNALLPLGQKLPEDMVAFLELGEPAMDAARAAIAQFEKSGPASAAIPFKTCDLL
jgi:hypothetical protein